MTVHLAAFLLRRVLGTMRGVLVSCGPARLPVVAELASTGRRATIPPKRCPTPDRVAVPEPEIVFPTPFLLLILCGTQLRPYNTTRRMYYSFRSLTPVSCLLSSSLRSLRRLWMTTLRVCWLSFTPLYGGGAGLGSRTTSCTGSSGDTCLGSCLRLVRPPRCRPLRRRGPRQGLPPGRKPPAQGPWRWRVKRRRRLVSAAQGTSFLTFFVVGCDSSKLSPLCLSFSLHYSSHVFAYKLQYF